MKVELKKYHSKIEIRLKYCYSLSKKFIIITKSVPKIFVFKRKADLV